MYISQRCPPHRRVEGIMTIAQRQETRPNSVAPVLTRKRDSQPGILVPFLPGDAMHKRGLWRHVVSVCPCVRPSRSWIPSKRVSVLSDIFHRRVDPSF